MEWDAIGAIGETVGAAAVVVTLVFLVVQLRQNARDLRMSTRARVTETIASTLAVLQDDKFAETATFGFANYNDLGEKEKLQFASFILRMLRVWEDAYFQWQQGGYDEGAWASNRAFMLDILSLKGSREFFNLRRPWFDSRFVTYVESELDSYQVQVVPEYLRRADSSEWSSD